MIGNRAVPTQPASDVSGHRCILLFWLLVSLTAGCGNTLYAVNANAASTKLAEAKELGADTYAPYEYYMAKEHLEKAQTEAAEADYSDAAGLSESAESYAEKAIVLSREAHRGAGR